MMRLPAASGGVAIELAPRLPPRRPSPPARRRRGGDGRHAWKRHFRPQRIGSLVVKPSWARYALRGDAQTGGRLPETALEIDPGMAFGPGQHPPTATRP